MLYYGFIRNTKKKDSQNFNEIHPASTGTVEDRVAKFDRYDFYMSHFLAKAILNNLDFILKNPFQVTLGELGDLINWLFGC